jgi:hypothetical protein
MGRWKKTVLAAAGTAVLAGAAAVLGGAAPAGAAANTLVASWQMNEPAGSTVMTDSSGHGITGTVGSGLTTGFQSSGTTGYKWDSVDPVAPPAKPQRLVQVNNSALNPGTKDYAVTIRYRTTHSYGNVIQKGQNATAGGYFKFEQPNGFISCLFKGATGQQRGIVSKIALNDGAFHTVRCERTVNQLTMTIDGTTTYKLVGPTGNISNTFPLTIGGKLSCDQVKVTCDYFAGTIDWVTIESS